MRTPAERLSESMKFRQWRPVTVHRKASDHSAAVEEKHYSPSELGKVWGVSDDTIRAIFADEDGVLCIGNGGSRRKRRYITMRIPESVVVRVHRKLSAKPLKLKC